MVCLVKKIKWSEYPWVPKQCTRVSLYQMTHDDMFEALMSCFLCNDFLKA